MALTEITYTGTGLATFGPIPFDALDYTTDIKASINGAITTAFTVDPATKIVTFSSAPAIGATVRIYRDTNDENKSATFYSGSAIRASDLNNNFDQTLYLVQEIGNNAVDVDGSNAMAGDLDMGGFKVINMAAPTSDGAAANKQYVDSRGGNVTAPGHTRWTYNAVGGETTLSGIGSTGGTLQYSATREQVFLNGALLQRGVDYTADNDTSITLLSGPLLAGDLVDVRCVNNLVAGVGSTTDDITYPPQFTGAVTRTASEKLKDVINVKDFGAVGNGVADDTAAIQAAINAADGRVVFAPAGTYVITSTLSNNLPPSFGAFAPGFRLVGEGTLVTFFDNRVASAPMIDIDSAAHGGIYEASWGCEISNLAIINTTSPVDSVGIRVLNGYQIKLDHLYIKGMTAHGIELKNGLYVDDGWNMVSITNCWIDSCLGWGIKADGSAGRNEGSFTYLNQVFFQTCGTASVTLPPPSGGMIWKGQILTMDQCAFANGVQNVGLFIKGESGLGQTVKLNETAFENCYKRSLYCTGIANFKASGCQFYNNDTFTATNQVEFDGSSFTVRNVSFDQTTIRATSGNNPITAFKISGVNAELSNCSVENTNWDNFDFAGQTRFDGFKDKSTLIAYKAAAQDVYNTVSDIVWDTETSDLQSIYNTATGWFEIAYPGIFQVKGRITITNMDANAQVTIALYNQSTASVEQTISLNADGVTTQSFPFDFTGNLGALGLTRQYSIRVTQQSVGSKALDVSDPGYNQLSVVRIKA